MFIFLSELFAIELLDFIHVQIEDRGDSIEPDLAEKRFPDYFEAFLFNKDFKNTEEILNHVNPEIRMKHCIALFGIIAKKIQERT